MSVIWFKGDSRKPQGLCGSLLLALPPSPQSLQPPEYQAAKVRWMHDQPVECRRMGVNVRKVYEAKYTPERNYEMLMEIYREAIKAKGLSAEG